MTDETTHVRMAVLLCDAGGSAWSCLRCAKDIHRNDDIRCNECGRAFHWQCYRLPTGLFDSRLDDGVAEAARRGDARRCDFKCPRCNFELVMGRAPDPSNIKDCYLTLCDVQLTLDEFHYDSQSGADGNYTTLLKMSRWGRDMDVPVMVAHSAEDLQHMHHDHRQLGWYCVDQTTTLGGRKEAAKWETMKKHRSAVFNFYERSGVPKHRAPTATIRFTHRMNGLLQRLGNDSAQAKVFDRTCIRDLTSLLRSDYQRARGERKVTLALANLAFHAHLQAGLRAGELWEQRVGGLMSSLVIGDTARRMKIRPHLRLTLKRQTKGDRFKTATVPCAYQAKRAPLCTGLWTRVAVAELRRVGRGHDDDLVFTRPDGAPWTMSQFWHEQVMPRLVQLKEAKEGGLERTDLDAFGSNSFRRSWLTLARSHPDSVSEDLCERQGRWKKEVRGHVLGRMVSLYFDPEMRELLLATYWL